MKFSVTKLPERLGSPPSVCLEFGDGHAVKVSGAEAPLAALLAELEAIQATAPAPAGPHGYTAVFLVAGRLHREIFKVDPPGIRTTAQLADLELKFSAHYGAGAILVSLMPIEISPQVEIPAKEPEPETPADPASGSDVVPEMIQ